MNINLRKILAPPKLIISAIFLTIFIYFSYRTYSLSELPICNENNSDSDEEIVIDFETCLPCKGTEYFGLGSFHYRIEGKSENICILRYGMEVENPNWNGYLNNYCKVPISLGLTKFEKNRGETSETGSIVSVAVGYNLERINQYCERR